MATVMVEPSLIGRTFSHYRILDEIGTRGIGVVYRAEDLQLGRFVAIKILPTGCAGNRQARRRFRQEVQTVSSLNHPHICAIYDTGEHDHRSFVVMELLEGRSLASMIDKGPLEIDEVLKIGIQAADALDAAHSAGVLHRDLRPENIFLTDQGDAKVLNFGLARLTGGAVVYPGQLETPDGEKPELHEPVSPRGTVAYVSPEQALGEDLDGRTDIFALGVTIYEMSTGCQPFSGPTVAAVFDGILHRDPIFASELNPALPRRLDRIIRKALEKQKHSRYPTARQMLTDLKQVRWGVDSDSYISQQAKSLVRGGHLDRGEGIKKDQEPRQNASGKPRKRLVWNRKIMLLGSLFLAIVLILAVIPWLDENEEYLPCIVIGDLATSSEPFDSDLVEFLIQRSLSQFPDVRTFTAREFESAVARQHVSDGFQQPTPLPSLKLTGEIQPSVAGVVLQIELENRSQSRHDTVYLRSADDLLGGSLDTITLNMLESYNEIARVPVTPSYRTVSELLTSDWDALRYFWEGEKAWTRLNLEDAERWLRSAFEIDPAFSVAHLKLAEVKMYRRQFELAEQEVAAAERRPRGLTELDRLRIQAIRSRVAGQTFEERRNLRQLVAIRPYRKEYLYDLAESYFHTADVDEAISGYLDVLRLDATFALAYNHLGYCYSWKGEHASAISALKRYLEIDHSANAYDSLGDAYLHSGEYAEAIQMKSRALELNPNQYHTKRGIGFLLILQGMHQEAERVLLRYLEQAATDVEYASHYAALAFLHYSRGNLQKAQEMCRAGLTLKVVAPYDEEMLWLQGLIAIRRGDLPAARDRADRMKALIDEGSIGPMNFRPIFKHWIHLQANIHAEDNRSEEALEELQQLQQIKEKLGYWATAFDRPYFLYAIGQIYERLGLPDEAMRVYRDGLAYNPNFALIHYRLGTLLEAKGDRDNALAELQRFVEIWEKADPSIPEVQSARVLLEELLSPSR